MRRTTVLSALRSLARIPPTSAIARSGHLGPEPRTGNHERPLYTKKRSPDKNTQMTALSPKRRNLQINRRSAFATEGRLSYAKKTQPASHEGARQYDRFGRDRRQQRNWRQDLH